MRRKKNGERWFMDESFQRQAEIAQAAGTPQVTDRDLLRIHMQQALGYVEWFAPTLKIDDALPVVTAKVALRLLIEFLERNK